jgi:hypothetical protein
VLQVSKINRDNKCCINNFITNYYEKCIVNFLAVGIGAALCRTLVEAGMIVCGMSKRKDKMEVMQI